MTYRFWGFDAAAAVVRVWVPVITVAAFLVALAALKGTYIDPKFPSPFYEVSLWIGISAGVFVFVGYAIERFGSWVERDVVDGFRTVKRDELQDLLPLYDRLVAAQRPTLNELKDIFNANNQVFRFYEEVTKQGAKKSARIKGFCSILPMTKEATALLAEERLNGLRIDRSHLCGPRRPCKTIYIGSIGGDGHRARAAVLNYVLGFIDDSVERRVSHVYTRPVTVSGLRVAKKYGFRPVKPDAESNELGRLYVLDISDRIDSVRSTHR